MQRVLISALALGAILALPVSSWASPMENATGARVFTGPIHPHASAIYLNPAALGLTRPGQHLYLGTGLRWNRTRFNRRVVGPDGNTLVPGPSVTSSTLSPSGNLAFHTSVGDRGYFGVSIHTPFWEEFSTEPETGYHVAAGRLWQSLFSLAGAYRASSRFYFGLGLGLGVTRLEFDFLRDTALEAGSSAVRGVASDCNGTACGHENRAAAQRIEMNVGTSGFGELFLGKNLALSVGIAARPYKNWWLGVSYVSPPGVIARLDVDGNARVIEAPRDGGATLRGRGEIIFRMPQSIHVGIRGPLFSDYSLIAAVRWQNFSRHDTLDIRLFGGDFTDANDVPEWHPRFRGFSDTWRVQAGIEGEEGKRLRFGGRLRFETGATKSQNITPLQVHSVSASLGSGIEFRMTESWIIAAGYDLRWFPKTGGDDSGFDPIARVQCVDSGYAFDACTETREGRGTPTAAGTYRRFDHGFSLAIRYNRL